MKFEPFRSNLSFLCQNIMMMDNILAASTAIPPTTAVPQAAPRRAQMLRGAAAESRNGPASGGGGVWDGHPDEGEGRLETARLMGQDTGGTGADSQVISGPQTHSMAIRYPTGRNASITPMSNRMVGEAHVAVLRSQQEGQSRRGVGGARSRLRTVGKEQLYPVVMSTKLQREHDANLRRVTSALAKQARIDRIRREGVSRLTNLDGQVMETEDEVIVCQNQESTEQGDHHDNAFVPRTFEVRISSRERSSRASCSNVQPPDEMMARAASPTSDKSGINSMVPRIPRLNVRLRDQPGKGVIQEAAGFDMTGPLHFKIADGPRMNGNTVGPYSAGPAVHGLQGQFIQLTNVELMQLGIKKNETIYCAPVGPAPHGMHAVQMSGPLDQAVTRAYGGRQVSIKDRGGLPAHQFRDVNAYDAGINKEPLASSYSPLAEVRGRQRHTDHTPVVAQNGPSSGSACDAQLSARIETQRRHEVESDGPAAARKSSQGRGSSLEGFAIPDSASPGHLHDDDQPDQHVDLEAGQELNIQSKEESTVEDGPVKLANYQSGQGSIEEAAPKGEDSKYIQQIWVQKMTIPNHHILLSQDSHSRQPMAFELQIDGKLSPRFTEATVARSASPHGSRFFIAPPIQASFRHQLRGISINPYDKSRRSEATQKGSDDQSPIHIPEDELKELKMKAFLNKPTLMLDANKILNPSAFSPHAQAKKTSSASIPNRDQSLAPRSAQAHHGINRNSPINGQALDGTVQAMRMVSQRAPTTMRGQAAFAEQSLATNADAHKPRNIRIVVNPTDLARYSGPFRRGSIEIQKEANNNTKRHGSKKRQAAGSNLSNTMRKRFDHNMFISSLRQRKSFDLRGGLSSRKHQNRSVEQAVDQQTVTLSFAVPLTELASKGGKPKSGAGINIHTMKSNLLKKHILNEINKRCRLLTHREEEAAQQQPSSPPVQPHVQASSGQYQPLDLKHIGAAEATHTNTEYGGDLSPTTAHHGHFEQFKPQKVLDLNRQIEMETTANVKETKNSARKNWNKVLRLKKGRQKFTSKKEGEELDGEELMIESSRRQQGPQPGAKISRNGRYSPREPVQTSTQQQTINEQFQNQNTQRDMQSMEHAYREYFVDRGGETAFEPLRNSLGARQLVIEPLNRWVKDEQNLPERGSQTLTGSQRNKDIQKPGHAVAAINYPTNINMKIVRKGEKNELGSPPLAFQSPDTIHLVQQNSIDSGPQGIATSPELQRVNQRSPQLGEREYRVLNSFGQLREWTQPDASSNVALQVSSLANYVAEPFANKSIQEQMADQTASRDLSKQAGAIVNLVQSLTPNQEQPANVPPDQLWPRTATEMQSKQKNPNFVLRQSQMPNKEVKAAKGEGGGPFTSSYDKKSQFKGLGMSFQRGGSTNSQGFSVASQLNTASVLKPRMDNGDAEGDQLEKADKIQPENQQNTRLNSEPDGDRPGVIAKRDGTPKENRKTQQLSGSNNTEIKNSQAQPNDSGVVEVWTSFCHQDRSQIISQQQNQEEVPLISAAADLVKSKEVTLSKEDNRSPNQRTALSGPIYVHSPNQNRAPISSGSSAASNALNKDIQNIIGSYQEGAEMKTDPQMVDIPIYLRAHQQHCSIAQRQLNIKKIELPGRQDRQNLPSTGIKSEAVAQSQRNDQSKKQDGKEGRVDPQTNMQSLNTTHRLKDDLDGLTLLKSSADGLMVVGADQRKSGEKSDESRRTVCNHKHNPLYSNVQSTDQAILLGNREAPAADQNEEDSAKVKTIDASKNKKMMMDGGSSNPATPQKNGLSQAVPGVFRSDQSLKRPPTWHRVHDTHSTQDHNRLERIGSQNSRGDLYIDQDLSGHASNQKPFTEAQSTIDAKYQFSQVSPQITVKIEISPERNAAASSLSKQSGQNQQNQRQSGSLHTPRQREVALVTIVCQRQQLDVMTSPRHLNNHQLARSEDSGTTPSSIGPIEHKNVYLQAQRQQLSPQADQDEPSIKTALQHDAVRNSTSQSSNKPHLHLQFIPPPKSSLRNQSSAANFSPYHYHDAPSPSHQNPFSQPSMLCQTSFSQHAVSRAMAQRRSLPDAPSDPPGASSPLRKSSCIPPPLTRQSLEQRESVHRCVHQFMRIKRLGHVKKAHSDRKQILEQLPVLIRKRQEQLERIKKGNDRKLEQKPIVEQRLKEMLEEFVEFAEEEASGDEEACAHSSLENTFSSWKKRAGTVQDIKNKKEWRTVAVGQPQTLSHTQHENDHDLKVKEADKLDQERNRLIQSQGDPLLSSKRHRRAVGQHVTAMMTMPPPAQLKGPLSSKRAVYSQLEGSLLTSGRERERGLPLSIRSSFANAMGAAKAIVGQHGVSSRMAPLRASIPTPAITSRAFPFGTEFVLGSAVLDQRTRDLHRARKNQNNYQGKYIHPKELRRQPLTINNPRASPRRRGHSQAVRLRSSTFKPPPTVNTPQPPPFRTLAASPNRSSHRAAPSLSSKQPPPAPEAPDHLPQIQVPQVSFFANHLITSELRAGASGKPVGSTGEGHIREQRHDTQKSEMARLVASRTHLNVGTASLTEEYYRLSEYGKEPGLIQAFQERHESSMAGMGLEADGKNGASRPPELPRLRTAAQANMQSANRSSMGSQPEYPLEPKPLIPSLDVDTACQREGQRTGVPGPRKAKKFSNLLGHVDVEKSTK